MKKKVPLRRGAKLKRALEFSMLNRKLVNHNYLKHLKSHLDKMKEERGLGVLHLGFLLFVYDLEFFTIGYVNSEILGIRRELVSRMYIRPLVDAGFIGVYMYHGLASQEDKQMFGTTSQVKRFAMTQAGRLFVQRFYNSLTTKPEKTEE